MNRFRERQTLRWQEAERKRIAAEPATHERHPRLLERLWRSTVSVWKTIFATILSLSGAASAMFIIGVFVYSVVERTISVQPLLVPKSVADAGFTADVAAL